MTLGFEPPDLFAYEGHTFTAQQFMWRCEALAEGMPLTDWRLTHLTLAQHRGMAFLERTIEQGK